MALRKPTVRARSAPRKHFGFLVAAEKSVLGIGGALRHVEEAGARDASRPPVTTDSARFCCAPATACRAGGPSCSSTATCDRSLTTQAIFLRSPRATSPRSRSGQGSNRADRRDANATEVSRCVRALTDLAAHARSAATDRAGRPTGCARSWTDPATRRRRLRGQRLDFEPPSCASN
jgi:hypothetical protein